MEGNQSGQVPPSPQMQQAQDSQIPINKEHKRSIDKKKVILIILGVLFVLSLGAFSIWAIAGDDSTSEENTAVVLEETVQENTPTPTPFKFQEMTIPYLSQRDYSSTMGELNQSAENTSYTSYLTSYDSDGLRVNAQLTRPKDDMPEGGWPAIVFVHGYIPPQNYQTLSNYSAYVDYLARNGFVVFKIDLRGHGSSEGEASGAYYSPDYVIDVLNAREALKTLDFVHDGKIGLWGHSMAGNVTFRAFVAARDIPAVSIWAGAVYSYEDWEEYGLNDNSYRPPSQTSDRQRRRQELFDTHGDFDPESDFWQQVVPTNYLDGISGAIQLNHAGNDDVVNVGYSRGLVQILANTDIEHELNEYSSGGHNISGSAFNQAMQNTVTFFDEYLN